MEFQKQFTATVHKNFLEKRRNIRITACECFSHLAMLTILLLGVNLSRIIYYIPENYVKFDLMIPPNIITTTSAVSALALTDDDYSKNTGTSNGNSGMNTNPNKTQPLFTFNYGNFISGFRRQMKGPMIIPSFDLFVTGAQLFTLAAHQFPTLLFYVQQSSIGQTLGNIVEFGDFHFAPNSKATHSLINYLNTTTASFKTVKHYLHDSESKAVDFILNNLDKRTFALIVVREISAHKINYVIRMNYTTLPNSNLIIDSIARGLNKGYQGYQLSGFLTMEQTVDQWALNYAVQQVKPRATCTVPDIVTVPAPTYAFDSNVFYSSVGALLGLALTMSTLYPVSRLVKSVVEEKESKMREVMKIMGLSDTVHHLSWFITAFLNFFWISLSSTYIAHISFLPSSNPVLLFLYFFFFNLSEVTLAFLISVFFSNSKLAAIVGPVMLFLLILPKYIFFGSNTNEGASAKYGACILSPTAFSFGSDILAQYEYAKVGVQWDNFTDGDFNFFGVLFMMFVDFVVYGFLAWYLDQTIAHETGIAKHPLFLFLPSYWMSLARRLARAFCFLTPHQPLRDIGGMVQFLPPEMILDQSDYDFANRDATQTPHLSLYPNDVPSGDGRSGGSGDGNPSDNVEKLSEENVGHVQVIASRLRKVYPNGKRAVQEFSVAMVEGQITCLLGHNGAGKSTVISMITGLTTMTDGECSIYGHAMPGDCSDIRRLTGICPQINVLFPSLTVREHLYFFGTVKGLYGQKLREEAEQLIDDVGLSEKRHVPSSSLSGGMKRKLQLAMALIGGSKFVLLDEPTSGMDPYSRRATWELLQRKRSGRVIVLTTHFLEEADILGDRIAIMSEGLVRCSGTSLFLKTRFGAGYVLSMAKTASWNNHPHNHIHSHNNNNEGNAELSLLSNTAHKNQTNDPHHSNGTDSGEIEIIDISQLQRVKHLVQALVPDAELTSHVAGELIFTLPLTSVPVFGTLFQSLQQRAEELGIGSYGVSLTSLEQVFIRLAKEAGHTGEDHLEPTFFDKAYQRLAKACGSFSAFCFPPGQEGWFRRFQYGYDKALVAEHEGNASNLPCAPTHSSTAVAGAIALPSSSSSTMPVSSSLPRIGDVDSDQLRRARVERYVRSGIADFEDHREDAVRADVQLAAITSTATATRNNSIISTMERNKSNGMTGGAGGDTRTTNSIGDRQGIEMRMLGNDHAVDDMDGERGEHKGEGVSASATATIDATMSAIPVNSTSNEGINPSNNSTPLTSQAQIKDGLSIPTTGKIRIQLYELLRKRYITTSRDMKGFFFQIVFPAIQICLILAILTISLNPAGHTVRLNASIYSKYFPVTPPNILIAGKNIGPNSIAAHLSNRVKPIYYQNTTTSFQLGSDLKDSGNTKFPTVKELVARFPVSSNRLISLVFDDEVPINVHVDWRWVKEVVPYLFAKGGLIAALGKAIKVDLTHHFTIGTGRINTRLPRVLRTILRGNNTRNSTSIRTRLKQIIERVRPVTNATDKALTTVLNALLNDSVSGDFSITSEGIKFSNSINYGNQSVNGSKNTANSDFVFTDVVLHETTTAPSGKRQEESYALGDVAISISSLLRLLPNGKQLYYVNYPASVTVMFNSTSQHGIAAFRGEVVAAAWQKCYNSLPIPHANRTMYPNVTYVAKNHPLPLTAKQTLEIRVVLALLASLFILVPLCYIPGSFVTFLVRERTSKAKHQQLVSSVSPYLYWISAYLWDMALFSVLVLLIIISLYCYGQTAAQIFISSAEGAFAVFLLLFCYGLSVLPLCYLYSMMFDNHSTAQISIMAINFASGFVAVLAYFVMNGIPVTKDAASKIVHFFRFFPPYLLGEGLIAVSSTTFSNSVFNTKVETISYFRWTVCGRDLVFMFVEAIGYFLVVLLTEASFTRDWGNYLQKRRALLALQYMKQRGKLGGTPGVRQGGSLRGVAVNAESQGGTDQVPADEDAVREEEEEEGVDVDDDVAAEQAKVESLDADRKGEYALCIDGLVKVYPPSFLGGQPKHAVRGMSLACPPGETFGFLGINGAGKSSTLNVLTGDIAPTGGEVFIGGHPLSDPLTRLAIGYCPQSDPLFDLLTARETLWFYGRIRGIDEELLKRRVNDLIDQVGLTKFAERTSGTYSGGNKRKLSLAIALIGSPRVLLLDEPSSGMDAFARRQMWDVIAAVSEDRSVVLTTHSMEECEALCTRIGIMVDGSFRCLGSAQHLKAKFGTGYQIEIRLSSASEACYAACLTLCKRLCPTVTVEEKHGKFVRLNAPTLDLSEAFRVLEENKQAAGTGTGGGTGSGVGTVMTAGTGGGVGFNCVTDYTVSQNTLEQVFIKFARLQEAEADQPSHATPHREEPTPGTDGVGSNGNGVTRQVVGVGIVGRRGMGVTYGADGQPVTVSDEAVPGPTVDVTTEQGPSSHASSSLRR